LRREEEHESGARPTRGMGLAARVTLGVMVAALLVALPLGWLLDQGARGLLDEAADGALRDMAATTVHWRQAGVELPAEVPAEVQRSRDGRTVQVARVELRSGEDFVPVRMYVVPDAEGHAAEPILLAPADSDPTLGQRLLVLVLLVCGGLVVAVVTAAAWISRRAMQPVKAVLEDVLAVSRGRLDHAVRTHRAAGEVAMLARAVDRMVRDIREKQASREALARRQREVEALRELRRNLKPLAAEPPPGLRLETRLVEAEGPGTGDFVDALTDGEGRLSLVVGATASRGMPGALLMAMTRAYLRGAIQAGQGPAEACDQTNTALNRDLAKGLYASAMVARLDPASGRLELVSTGHQAPAIRWDADAGQYRKLQPNGIALGFDPGPVFRKSLETVVLDFGPGDALFLFSPSGYEAKGSSDRALGEKGVLALARVAVEEGLEAAMRRLEGFLGGPPDMDLAFALLVREAA